MIFDGHNSHFTFEFVHFCHNNRIEIFCLPAHTTHILQSLDVGCFSPLQSHYSKGVESFLRDTGHIINKTNFLPILYEARRQAYSSDNLKSAFLSCGFIPFNPRVVLGRFTGTASADTRITKLQTPTTPPKSLSKLAVKTHSNTRSIRHLQLEALQRIPKDDTILAELVKKMANAAMGSFVDTFLEKTRADKLQQVLNDFAQAGKNNPRSRNQITSKQAVTGRELIQMDLSHVKQPTKPKRTTVKPRPKTAPRSPKASQSKKSTLTITKGKGKQKAVVLEVVDEGSEEVAFEAVDDSDSGGSTHSGAS